MRCGARLGSGLSSGCPRLGHSPALFGTSSACQGAGSTVVHVVTLALLCAKIARLGARFAHFGGEITAA